jgi:hypothetical protein
MDNAEITLFENEEQIEDVSVEEKSEPAVEDGRVSETEESDSDDYYSRLVDEDLNTLRKSFRELKDLSELSELENPVKFARLRDEGFSAVEAYLECQRVKRTYDNRSHLRSSLPQKRMRDGLAMSKDELIAARELFPDISDAEIQKLYKSVTRQ